MAGNNAIPSTSAKPPKQWTRTIGKKPGKVSWIHGTKEKFFGSPNGHGKIGKVLRRHDEPVHPEVWIQYEEDLEEDVTDPNAGDPDVATLTKEEADRRSKISSNRIGQWYRVHYGGGVEQGKKNLFKDLLSVGANIGATQPMKMQTWQYYSKLHYEECVKPCFEVAWKAAQQRAKDLELEEPHVVKVRGEVTRQAWEEETEEFKVLMVAAQNKEHTQMLVHGRWAVLRRVPILRKSCMHTIQEQFSMNVVIMLCGPIGEHGGAVEVRSVHSGMTTGLNPKKWYQFDPRRHSVSLIARRLANGKTPTSDPGEAERERRHVASSASSSDTPGPMAGASTSSGGPARATETGASGLCVAGPSGSHAPISRGKSNAPTPHGMPPARPTPPVGEPPACEPPPHETPVRKTPPARETPAREGTPVLVHEAWRRKDMGKWSEEVRRAHGAFAMREKWPEDWARLVNEYLDFEAVAGYPNEEGPHIGGDGRPSEVTTFLTAGRKWHLPPKIKHLGKLGEKRLYADNWWMWWRSLQPSEREVVEETGMMTMPMEMEWGRLTKMSGPNGFLQVMASLFWWGLEEFRDGPEDNSGWPAAAGDVESILYGVLKSGEVQEVFVFRSEGVASTSKKGNEKAVEEKRKAAEAEVEDDGRCSKRTAGEKAGDTNGRQTRAATRKT
ncbi:hypothetical protein B0H16DRAFT_1460179 [Mycena metata]|uniref:Uncharacterized protein n=1 Tax=Mycena metata TaxID=1033252 RepID=A0AAD7NA25_9AGAR|nr:hypothetical protein B0H16DRAFT_1460179 [Mycena metata]